MHESSASAPVRRQVARLEHKDEPPGVLSGWRVEDRSAATLTQAFYAGLQRPGATIASALRKAQVQLINSNASKHPYYWAPFVLSTAGQVFTSN